jgi:Ecdysteroid kinase-like family
MSSEILDEISSVCDTVPDTPSPTWLYPMLERAFASYGACAGQLESCEVVRLSGGYIGDVFRIVPCWKTPLNSQELSTASFVLKLAPNSEHQVLADMKLHARECVFYDSFVPEFCKRMCTKSKSTIVTTGSPSPSNSDNKQCGDVGHICTMFPRTYCCISGDDTNSGTDEASAIPEAARAGYIVMQDMSPTQQWIQCSLTNGTQGMSLQRMSQSLNAMAALHAAFACAPPNVDSFLANAVKMHSFPLPVDDTDFAIMLCGAEMSKVIESLEEAPADVLAADRREPILALCAQLADAKSDINIMTRNASKHIGTTDRKQCTTLIHGDVWCNNFLFRSDKICTSAVALLDFQWCNVEDPWIDVVLMLLSSLRVDLLESHFDSLLRQYAGFFELWLEHKQVVDAQHSTNSTSGVASSVQVQLPAGPSLATLVRVVAMLVAFVDVFLALPSKELVLRRYVFMFERCIAARKHLEQL